MSKSGTLGKKCGLVIGSLNAPSLLKHKDEIKTILNDHKIDILALNETKLNNLIDDNLVSIGGYRFERHDRNIHGGGVGIYIQNNIHYDIHNDLPIGKLEIVCIEVKQKGSSPFAVLAWYRPPEYNHNNFDELENVLKILDSENKEIILIGDTNCDNLAEEGCKNGMKRDSMNYT